METPKAQGVLQLSNLATRDQVFLTGVAEYQQYIHQWAVKKGFWKFPITFVDGDLELTKHAPTGHYLVRSTKMMLMVSELGEMLESIRKQSESKIEGFTNEEEELADAVIRILDYAGAYNLRLGEAIVAKMAVNEGRPYQHGKQF